jgi:predicted 3-demethylubiquinone-9 3-methyltransferase (glyoxalase superfamily)
MQKITPFLWFDGRAEEAARFYTSIFEDSSIVSIARGGKTAESPAISVTFRLAGQDYIALNGGPHFTFTPAISLFVSCETQAEVDDFWTKLSAGGEPQRCGWLKDKFGLSWQVVPRILGELLHDPDPDKAKRVMAAMMAMTKIDILGLQQA